MSKYRREQTLNEETANWITHALGIAFAVATIPFLIAYAIEKSNVSTIWGVSVFGFAMLAVYMASTIYHATAPNTNKKKTLRICDHIGIFLMIGGSYTPLVLKYIDTPTATWFLGAMWAIIVLGSILKIYHTGKYVLLEVIIYIALSCMLVFIIKPLVTNIPTEIFTYIWAGGLFYGVGVAFYLWKKLSYHHAVWHVFVLAGTITHFVAIYKSIPVMVRF
ncbi:MAG TPA: hemolysin III family protein [Chitinophagales bacterium]|nr:hemolysin III family protein [Chitinophagales bacterium]